MGNGENGQSGIGEDLTLTIVKNGKSKDVERKYHTCYIGLEPFSSPDELATLLRFAREGGADLSGATDKDKAKAEAKAIREVVSLILKWFIAKKDESEAKAKAEAKKPVGARS